MGEKRHCFHTPQYSIIHCFYCIKIKLQIVKRVCATIFHSLVLFPLELNMPSARSISTYDDKFPMAALRTRKRQKCLNQN